MKAFSEKQRGENTFFFNAVVETSGWKLCERSRHKTTTHLWTSKDVTWQKDGFPGMKTCSGIPNSRWVQYPDLMYCFVVNKTNDKILIELTSRAISPPAVTVMIRCHRCSDVFKVNTDTLCCSWSPQSALNRSPGLWSYCHWLLEEFVVVAGTREGIKAQFPPRLPISWHTERDWRLSTPQPGSDPCLQNGRFLSASCLLSQDGARSLFNARCLPSAL